MVNKGADWSRWSDDYLTKPCEIDELVAKIEKAWEKKDDEFKKDMQEKIQKVVESPSSVFDLFPRKKWHFPPPGATSIIVWLVTVHGRQTNPPSPLEVRSKGGGDFN